MTGKPQSLKRRPANLRLAQLRIEAGLSQRRLAALAGVSPGVVQLAEKGWTPQPRHAGQILEVLESELKREVRYIDIWSPRPGRKSSRCA